MRVGAGCAVFQDLNRTFSDPTASTCGRDPDCVISTYIAPWEQFLRTYPTTKRSTQVINTLANHYQRVGGLYVERAMIYKAQPAIAPDFSVVLFRSDFMLFSEKNRMKAHTNQWVLTMPYPLERLAGATNRGQTMAPERQKPSQ
jgi:hypothetical protein